MICADALFRYLAHLTFPDIGRDCLTFTRAGSPAADAIFVFYRGHGDLACGRMELSSSSTSRKGSVSLRRTRAGKDVFVHITAVERSGIGPLDEGMRVSFETEPDKRGKGPKAVNLQAAT